MKKLLKIVLGVIICLVGLFGVVVQIVGLYYGELESDPYFCTMMGLMIAVGFFMIKNNITGRAK